MSTEAVMFKVCCFCVMSDDGTGVLDENGCCTVCGLKWQEEAPVSKWVSASLLEQFPSGPYAVYVYNPAVGREFTTRNQSAESAAVMAEQNAAKGFRVHVSLDVCG